MAPMVSSLLFVSLLCVIGTSSTSFDIDNPIRLVSDYESSIKEVVGDTRHALAFARFAKRYGKSYETAKEIKLRFGHFVKSLKMIRSAKRKGVPYSLALNQFADMSWEEFRSQKLGAAQNCSATRGNHKLAGVLLPEKVQDYKQKQWFILLKICFNQKQFWKLVISLES